MARKLYPEKLCPSCGKLHRNPKYCSLSCQQRFQTDKIIEEWLNSDQTTLPSSVKGYLRRQNNSCWICGTTEWMGQEIPLILDHINGNPEDHKLENLRLVCGNCDMQLPTYKSRNKGNGRHSRRQRYATGKSY